MASFWRKKIMRRRVLQRDGFRCRYCGARLEDTELTLDHVIPVIKGGKHTIHNLVTACVTCNNRKGNDHTVKPRNWGKIVWWEG